MGSIEISKLKQGPKNILAKELKPDVFFGL